MGGTPNEDALHAADQRELERFRGIGQLTNHWAHPPAPRSYYWYLTFEDATEVHAIAGRCQTAITFSYYDLTPLEKLHLTLGRVAFENDMTPDLIGAIEASAVRACGSIRPLDITVSSLGGTSGAVGFTASPSQPILHLREALRDATLTAYPDVPASNSAFHPHVTIAYSNSDGVLAADIISAVEKLTEANRAHVTIKDVALVLLERRQRLYAWQPILRIPLGG